MGGHGSKQRDFIIQLAQRAFGLGTAKFAGLALGNVHRDADDTDDRALLAENRRKGRVPPFFVTAEFQHFLIYSES